MNYKDNLKVQTLYHKLTSYFKSCKVDTYLDLGCGNGSLTLEISKIVGARNIYGVDIDEEALKNATTHGIKAFKCDLSKDTIPLPDESMDLITALDIIEHLLNPDHMLRESYRLLRKGGLFLSRHLTQHHGIIECCYFLDIQSWE